jgi:hypothetical protein
VIQRALMLVVAAAALAAAGVVCVVAAALAVFALARPFVGEAGAWAVVLGCFALLILLGGLVVASAAMPKRPKVKGEAAGIVDRLTDLARDRPVAAAAVACVGIVAAALAARNPVVIGTIARAFFDGLNKPKSSK